MRRPLLTALFALTIVLAVLATQSMAHFVFIVPQKEDANKVKIVFSESLEPEDEVDVLLLKKLKLDVRDMTGKVTELEQGTKENNAIVVKVPGEGTRVVYGTIDFGVMQRGKAKPNVLIYHAKSILGDPFDVAATILNHKSVELIAVGKPGALQFQLNIEGKPAPKTEVVVVLPDGTMERVNTDDTGRTPTFDEPGNYGAWARHWQDTPGERDGKKYEQVRNYAILVVTAPPPESPEAPAVAPAK